MPEPGRKATFISPPRLAALSIAAAVASYWLMAGTEAGRDLDAAVVALELENPIRKLPVVIGLMINPVTVGAGAVVIGIVAARQQGLWAGVAAVAVVVGAALLAIGLEHALAALDPWGWEAERVLGVGFYPSGHTTAAAALCLAAMIAGVSRWWPARPRVVGAAATILACPHILTAWHAPSDVLGALLVATAWAAVVVALTPLRPIDLRRRRERPRLRRWAVALGTFIALLALLELARRASVPLGPLHPLLMLTIAAVAAVAFTVTAAFARVLQNPDGGRDHPRRRPTRPG